MSAPGRRVWILQAILVVGVVAGSVALAGVMIKSREVPEADPRPASVPLVRTHTVTLGPKALFVETLGELRPRREGSLTAEVPGPVTTVSDAFVDGGAVRANEILLQLDVATLQVAVLTAEAQVAQAQAVLSQELAQSERAIAEWRRAAGSAGGRTEPGGAPEAAPPPLVAREPSLAEARAVLASAEAAVTEARLNLERATLRAPFDGFLRDARVSVGEYVQPGQVLATLYQADPMEVRFALSDRELARLDVDALLAAADQPEQAPGVEFDVSFAGRGSRFRGRIARVESEVDPVSRMVRVSAVVTRQGGTGDGLPLLAGTFVDLRVEGRAIPAAAELPRPALFRPDVVLVVSKEGRLERRSVKVALSTDKTVIVESGLGAGERVIVSPLDVAVEGMFVRTLSDEAVGDDL